MTRYLFLVLLLIFTTTAAYAVVPTTLLGSASSQKSLYLDGVLDSVVVEWDVNEPASYSGGDLWYSLAHDPQGDYVMLRSGATYTDASPDYFLFDGTDQLFFLSSGTNTAFLESLHKDDQDFWTIVTGRTKAGEGKVIWSTQGVNTSSVGVAQTFNTNEQFELQQYGGTTNPDSRSRDSYPADYTFFSVLSYDSTNHVARVWVNGDLTQESLTFEATASSATNALHIGGHTAAAFLPAGFRITSVAMGNKFLTSSEERAARLHYEERHVLDYTDETVTTFDFTDTADVELSTLTISDIVQIKGFSGPISLSISGDGSPQYRLCEDSGCSTVLTDWTGSAGTIQYGAGQYVQLRLTSSSDNATAFTATLLAGDQTVDWSITTVAASSPSLQDVVASTVFHIDFTKAESYSGSGTTAANLVASPADGAAQGDYNFTTTNLTFNGTAGDSAAYMSTSGSGYLAMTSNTSFTNSLHKTTGGSDFWLLMALQLPDDGATDGLFANVDGVVDNGLRSLINTSQLWSLQHRGDGGSFAATTTNAVPEATPTILIVSHSHNLNETTLWVGSSTGETFSHTFSDTSLDATAPLQLLRDRASGTPLYLRNGGRAYAFAMGNEYLDDTKADLLISELESIDWHNRDYTP